MATDMMWPGTNPDGRRTVEVDVPHSAFIRRVEHNGRGMLTVFFRDGSVDYRNAPIKAADQARNIVEAQERGERRSIGKWYNSSVKNTYKTYPRPSRVR
jgi:hypothetical protein